MTKRILIFSCIYNPDCHIYIYIYTAIYIYLAVWNSVSVLFSRALLATWWSGIFSWSTRENMSAWCTLWWIVCLLLLTYLCEVRTSTSSCWYLVFLPHCTLHQIVCLWWEKNGGNEKKKWKSSVQFQRVSLYDPESQAPSAHFSFFQSIWNQSISFAPHVLGIPFVLAVISWTISSSPHEYEALWSFVAGGMGPGLLCVFCHSPVTCPFLSDDCSLWVLLSRPFISLHQGPLALPRAWLWVRSPTRPPSSPGSQGLTTTVPSPTTLSRQGILSP